MRRPIWRMSSAETLSMTLKVRSIRVQHSMLDVFERRQTCVWNVRVWEHVIYGAGSGEAPRMQREALLL